MANIAKIRGSMVKFLEAMKACDELPEGLEDEAVKMAQGVSDAIEEEDPTTPPVEDDDPATPAVEEGTHETNLEAKITDAMTKVLRQYGLIKDSACSALDDVEKELEAETVNDADGEEDVTVDPEKINDAAARKAFLAEVKPLIASIPSAKTRASLSDSIAKLLRKNNTGDSVYSAIQKAAKGNAKTGVQTSDAKAEDQADLGAQWAAKFNPHYKKEG